MARAAYIETSAVRALRELITFAESADAKGDLLALTEGPGMLRASVLAEVTHLSATARHALAAMVRSAIHAAAGDRSVDLIAVTAIRPELVPVLPQKRGRRHQRLYAIEGPLRDVFLHQFYGLLSSVGTDRLLLCPSPDCGRAFLKIGRREFCSERCQRRVFIRGYDPFKARARRKDQYGKKAR